MRADIFWQANTAEFDTSCTGCGLPVFKGDPVNTLHQPHHLQHLYCVECCPVEMVTLQKS